MAWDLLEENFNDLTAWTDADSGDGESEISPAGILKQSNSASGSRALISQTLETGPGTADFTIEVKIKFGSVPAAAHNYSFYFGATTNDQILYFISAGMQVLGGGLQTAITKTWVADTWYTIRVIFHTSQTKADTYLDGVLQNSDVAAYVGYANPGYLWVNTNDQVIVANCEMSTDYLYIGAGQQVPSTTSIKKVSGVAHASIKKIGGVAIGYVKKIAGVE